MTRPIADATLGSRFWLKTDFTTAAHPIAHDGLQTVDVKRKNVHDSSVFTFIDAGGDSMAKSAIGKAELFAATHTLTNDERQRETAAANDSIQKLIGGENEKRVFLDQAVELFRSKHTDVSVEDARAVCERALMKLMATREFRERAAISRESLIRDGVAPLDVRLDAEGIASAKNAVAGLAHMLHEGQIADDAVLVLADGNFYDASNRSDLLRLTAESAKKVKEIFIGEKRMQALIDKCEAQLNGNHNLTENVKAAIRAHIEDLRHLKEAAVNARKAAVECIKTDYLLTDPSGKEKKDSKFQKAQLDAIRNSLRAFRYDLDNALGVGMGGASAWLRRKADNFFSGNVKIA